MHDTTGLYEIFRLIQDDITKTKTKTNQNQN